MNATETIKLTEMKSDIKYIVKAVEDIKRHQEKQNSRVFKNHDDIIKIQESITDKTLKLKIDGRVEAYHKESTNSELKKNGLMISAVALIFAVIQFIIIRYQP